jgi:hypothetical protein
VAAAEIQQQAEHARFIRLSDSSSSITSSSSKSSSSDSSSTTSSSGTSSSLSSSSTSACPQAKKKKTEDICIPDSDLFLGNATIDYYAGNFGDSPAHPLSSAAGEQERVIAPANVLSLISSSSDSSSSTNNNNTNNDESGNDDESDSSPQQQQHVVPAAAINDDVESSSNIPATKAPQQRSHIPDLLKENIIRAVAQKLKEVESPSSSDVSLSGDDPSHRVHHHRHRPAVVVVRVVDEAEEGSDDDGGSNDERKVKRKKVRFAERSSDDAADDADDSEQAEEEDADAFAIPIRDTARNVDADLLSNYFSESTAIAAALPADGGADDQAVQQSKNVKKSVLDYEIEARIKSMREKDTKGKLTWPNVMRHITSLLDLPQRHATMMLQILRAAHEDLADSTLKLSELPATGKGLIEPPNAELKEARLKYM